MTVSDNDIAIRLAPLCAYLEQELKAELTRQGHHATGKLAESIKAAVVKTATGNNIDAKGSAYAKYVDWGRKPGGRRVPINALIAWVEVKGLAQGKKAISLAWAIQYSIWKNGVPTNRDQSKTGFVTKMLAGNKDKIFTDVKKAVGDFYAIELNNIIREVKEKVYA